MTTLQRAATAVVAVVAVLIASVTPLAAADSTAALEQPDVHDMVVDHARQRVFVSHGSGTNAIEVYGFDGARVGSVPMQQGAAGLALSADGDTLYVALRDADAISRVSAATMLEVGRAATGTSACPDDLSLAGGRVWFTHGCSSGGRGLSSIGAGVVPGAAIATTISWGLYAAALSSPSPTSTTLFTAAEDGAVVQNLDVSTSTPVVRRAIRVPGWYFASALVAAPDGATVYVGGGSGGGAVALVAATLEAQRWYPSPDLAPNSLAVSPDGKHLAMAMAGLYAPSFLVYPVDSSTPTHDRVLPNSERSAAMTYLSSDRVLIARSSEPHGSRGSLVFVDGLAVEPVTAALTVADAAGVAQLRGRLRSTDGTVVAGRSVTLTVSDAAGTRAVAVVLAAGDGTFSFDHTTPPSGPGTYRAQWGGDAVHPVAVALDSWHPERAPAAAPLAAPTSLQDPARPVDLPRVAALITDDAHGVVYLAGGGGTTSVAVHGLDGAPTTPINGVRGASGFALSPDRTTLYVSEFDGRSIAVIDTAQRRVLGRWPTGAFARRPTHLAVAGDRLWITNHDDSSAHSLGEIDPSTPWELVDHNNNAFFSEPIPVASRTRPGTLWIAATNSSRESFYRFDVSGALSESSAYYDGGSFARGWTNDFAVTGDGADLIVASNGPSAMRTLDLDTFATRQIYPTPDHAVAAASTDAGNGLAAGAVVSSERSEVTTWTRGSSTARQRIAISGLLVPRTLDFTADESRLLAVTQDNGNGPVLHVLARPLDTTTCSVTITAPATITVGRDHTVAGRLTDSLGTGVASATVTVRRSDPAGATDARTVTTGEDGSYAFSDRALLPGRHRYDAASTVYGRSPGCSGTTTSDAAAAPPTTTTTTTTPAPAPTKPPEGSASPTRSGYAMVTAAGHVHAFGDAAWFGNAPVGANTAVDIEYTPTREGYWITDARGNVFTFGDAPYHGGGASIRQGERVTSISATPTGRGYWLFTTLGRVLPFGDAPFLGDMASTALNGPVLDSIPTATGRGYYLVASDGGIFTFGDATFRGSMGGTPLNAPVQSLVPDHDNLGYWLVASDGGIFAFDAAFYGSMGDTRLNRPVTGMVGSRRGYLMVAEDGGIFTFGESDFRGSLGDRPPPQPVTSVASVS